MINILRLRRSEHFSRLNEDAVGIDTAQLQLLLLRLLSWRKFAVRVGWFGFRSSSSSRSSGVELGGGGGVRVPVGVKFGVEFGVHHGDEDGAFRVGFFGGAGGGGSHCGDVCVVFD